MHDNAISNLLSMLEVIKLNNLEIFSEFTRDKKLIVYRDIKSKVIFIDQYITSDGEYEKSGSTGDVDSEHIKYINYLNYEDYKDTIRRIEVNDKFIINKNVLDFGCGSGTFLKAIKNITQSITGVELNERNRTELANLHGIECVKNIMELSSNYDLITLFHSFEHLSDPVSVLKIIKTKLKSDGKIIIEVPHAKDFLIQSLKNEFFIKHTLWSQHLILHTRESLFKILDFCGYKDIVIKGVQRYSLSNHLTWLNSNTPGGHKSIFSNFETKELHAEYEKSLLSIDATDTIVAYATI